MKKEGERAGEGGKEGKSRLHFPACPAAEPALFRQRKERRSVGGLESPTKKFKSNHLMSMNPACHS